MEGRHGVQVFSPCPDPEGLLPAGVQRFTHSSGLSLRRGTSVLGTGGEGTWVKSQNKEQTWDGALASERKELKCPQRGKATLS